MVIFFLLVGRMVRMGLSDGIISISKLKPLTDPWILKAVVMPYKMDQKLRLEYLIG